MAQLSDFKCLSFTRKEAPVKLAPAKMEISTKKQPSGGEKCPVKEMAV